jgi:choline dehydrogenase-like flavoprotein
LFIGEVLVSKKDRKCIPRICLDRRRFINGTYGKLGLALRISGSELISNQFLNIALDVVPRTSVYKFATHSIQSRPLIVVYSLCFFLERLLKRFLRGISEVLANLGFFPKKYSLWLKGEELPFIESKLSFNSHNKLVYSHKISNQTFSELNRTLDWLGKIIEENNLGKLQISNIVRNKDKLFSSYLNWHPMGTLRMGLDSKKSVCNSFLEVHRNSGLFIASSAVFPSSSNANPTFTTLAIVERCLNLKF